MTLPGGTADKVGNRFEGRWTALSALRVLREDAQAIRVEPPGPEGEGVEFFVRYPDRIEFHQVKRQRTGQGDWTIASLAAAGVLETFLKKLQADPKAHCTFASAHSASTLGELSERAQTAVSWEEYERDLLATSKKLKSAFSALKKAWRNLDDAMVFDLLRRVRVDGIDEKILRRLVAIEAESVLHGDQSKVVATLIELLLDNTNRYLTPKDLWDQLAKYDYKPAAWTRPQQTAVHIDAANTRYVLSRRETLIHGELVPRAEAEKLWEAIAGHRLVLVDGIAGTGKSDVVLQFVEKLKEHGTPFLAFRLDRTTPTRRPDDVGRDLGLPASPGAALAAVAQGRDGVLIVDQLDAVSAASGRNPQFLECVNEIVSATHAVANLRVVLVCRTFDVKNDSRIRQLVALGDDHTTVTVGPFERAQVIEQLARLGYPANALRDAQLELLRTPLHLSLLAEVTTKGEKQPDFSTPLDLYDLYWRRKRQELDERFSNLSSWTQVIDALVQYMSRHEALQAPAVIVDQWEPYATAMVSAHVLVRDGQQLAFFHETFFDYAFARGFVAQQGSVRSLLSQDQFLFRRAQVRQILAHQRLSDRAQYNVDLSYLLRDASVRFHLKDVVMSLLAQAEPTTQEWSMVEALLLDQESPLHSRAWGTLVSAAWFRLADARGFVENRLRIENGLTNRMVSILGYAVKDQPDRVAQLLAPYAGVAGWHERVGSVASQADLGRERALFDLYLKWVDAETLDQSANGVAGFGHSARELVKSRPDWACELLGRFIRRRAALAKVAGFSNAFDRGAHAFPHDLYLDGFVEAAASGSPASYIEYVLPVMLEILDAASKEESWTDGLTRDPIWTWRHFGAHGDIEDSLLVGAETAIRHIAVHSPESFDRLISEHQRTSYESVVSLLYEGFSANPTRYADTAIAFVIGNEDRLRVGYSNDRHWGTRRLFEAISPHASTAMLEELQTVLLAYYPEHPHSHGRAQFALLGGIDDTRRSAATQKRLAELARKFGRDDASPPEGVIGGAVRSPIEPNAAQKMSDDQWAGAVATHAGSYRDRDRTADFLKGGAEELANVLEEQAKQEPERFARLAVSLPDETNSCYFEAVLRGVAGAEEPIPLESTQALIERCHRLPNRPCGRWIARPLRKYAAHDLPPAVLDIISWYAINDPDPAREQDDDSPFDVLNDGLNSVRGGVASDIADLVEANPRHFEGLQGAIQSVTNDPVAAVRAMAAEIICALVASDLTAAQRLFLQLVQCPDDRLLATRYVYYYLIWQSADDFSQLRPTIERMIRSSVPSVREPGAAHATLISLRVEEARAMADRCLTSDDDSLRLGAAQVYRSNLTVPEHKDRCAAALRTLFNDSSAEIRETAGNAIWRLEGTQLADYIDLARDFVDSAAFEANANDIVHALERTTSAAPELILSTCERILDAFERTRHGPLAYQAGEAIALVLRAYADADDGDTRNRALDLIDRALRLDIYGTAKSLAEHDRWWGDIGPRS